MRLNEYVKSQLIKRSQVKGFNRYASRLQIEPLEIQLLKVDIDPTIGSLDIYFNVRSYTDSIRILNFIKRVKWMYRQSKYRNSFRKMIDIAITQALVRNDMQVNCTCPDFYYRFSYVATLKNFGFNTNQTIPATIRNPRNRGSICKHLSRILNAPSSWKSKVITMTSNIIKNNMALIEGR